MRLNVGRYKAICESIRAGVTKALPFPEVDRFTGCWISDIAQHDSGYVRIYRTAPGHKDARLYLHTLSYLLANYGRLYWDCIPEDARICHNLDAGCDGRPYCYNPNHLYLGNAVSNAADTIKYGERDTYLSPEDVKSIRLDIQAGFLTLTDIAQKHGVNRNAVSLIRQNKSYQIIR